MLYTKLNNKDSFLHKYVMKPVAIGTTAAFSLVYATPASSGLLSLLKDTGDYLAKIGQDKHEVTQIAPAAPQIPSAGNKSVDAVLYNQVQAQSQAYQDSLSACRNAQAKADSLTTAYVDSLMKVEEAEIVAEEARAKSIKTVSTKKVKSQPYTPQELIVSDNGECYAPEGGNTLLPTHFEAGNAQEAVEKLADAKPLKGTKITYEVMDLESQLDNTVRPVMGKRFGAGKDSTYQTIDSVFDTSYTEVPYVDSTANIDTTTGETLSIVYDTTGIDSTQNIVARLDTTNHIIKGGLEGKAVTDSMSRNILVKMLNGDTLTEEESNYKLAKGNYGLLLESDKKDPKGMNTANAVLEITGKSAGQYTQAEVDSMRMHLINGYEELLNQYEAEKAKTAELEGVLTTTQEELSATQSQADSLSKEAKPLTKRKGFWATVGAGVVTTVVLLTYFLWPEDRNPKGHTTGPVDY